MIDLHSHILPGIDDGASDIEESLTLLRAELSDGVDIVALTPHYVTQRESLDRFLNKREQAYASLTEAAKDIPVKLLLGAELTFASDLAARDLDALCIIGTKALLIELPEARCPLTAQEVFYSLKRNGFVPIAAHIERCSYIISDADMLDDLLLCGVLMQVNADTLLGGGKIRKRILELIESRRIHIIATDTHSMKQRPPMLGKAMALVKKKLGTEVTDSLNNVLELQ